MEYLNLLLGIVLLAAFVWVFARNSQRKGLLHAIIRIDTIVGIAAGIYLVVTSVIALF